MNINRRHFLGTAAGASVLALGGIQPANAAFPERNLIVVVPYTAGGGSDVSARLLAKDLEPIYGKPITIENRTGGGGWIGWGSLASSKPDGYTIGYINAPSLFPGYLDRTIAGGQRKENLESFTPLVNHVVDYNVWAVKNDSKYQNVKDVVEDGKKRPASSPSMAAATARTTTLPFSASKHRPAQNFPWCISRAPRKARRR
jgi:tripartite-type tricarboxylate transporter receptor subunit TctC